MQHVSEMRLRQIRDDADNFYRDEIKSIASDLIALRGLVRTLLSNEPDDPIDDAGSTVIDLWLYEACKLLPEAEGR